MSMSSTATSVSVGRRSGLGPRGDLLRQIAGVLTFAVVLWLNSLAGAGGLSGESIGVIAVRFAETGMLAGTAWTMVIIGLGSLAISRRKGNRARA